jgi:L-asparaginase II
MAVCASSSGEILGHFGDPTLATYERSLAKPLQLLTVFRLRPSFLDECSDAEIAVMSSSHNAEPEHLATIRNLLHRYGLSEDYLLCGTHDPFLHDVSWQMGKEGLSITPIYHNCSGKHTGMMIACLEQGWPLETYNRPDHPMQIANTRTVARYAGENPDTIEYGFDGCGVPTWWLDLHSIAVASARFADPDFGEDDFEKEVRERIFDAYHRAAWFTAGTKRFGTPFNEESDGKWLGKIGGEAVFGVCFRNRGIGIGIKVLDGNKRALPPSLLYVMKLWGLIDDDQLERLKDWVKVERHNAPGWLVGYDQVVESSVEVVRET